MKIVPNISEESAKKEAPVFNHLRSTVISSSLAPLMVWLNIKEITVNAVPGKNACNPKMQVIPENEDVVPEDYKAVRMTVVRNLVGIIAAMNVRGLTLDLAPEDIKVMRESYAAFDGQQSSDEEDSDDDDEEGEQRTEADDYVEGMIMSVISKLLPIHGRDYVIERPAAEQTTEAGFSTSVKITGKTLVGIKFAEAVNELLPEAFAKWQNKN